MTTLMARGKAINNCSMWLDYLTDQNSHETGDIVATYDTFGTSELLKNEPNKEMWKHLFEQNERAYHCKGNRGKTSNGKLQSAREAFVWLDNKWFSEDPQQNKELARHIAVKFKAKFGLDCVVALHWNKSKTNFHAHIMYSDRKKLDKPIEIRATRNEYYTEDWKRCKKADAVHIVKKGDLKETKYFEDIKDIRCTKGRYRFLKCDLKPFLAELTGQEIFNSNSLKIAQLKVKKEYTREAKNRIKKENEKIKEYNQLVDDLEDYSVKIEESFDPELFLDSMEHDYWNVDEQENAVIGSMLCDADFALRIAELSKQKYLDNKSKVAQQGERTLERSRDGAIVWKRVYDPDFNQKTSNNAQMGLLESIISFLFKLLGLMDRKWQEKKSDWKKIRVENWQIKPIPGTNLSRVKIGEEYVAVSNHTINFGVHKSNVYLDLSQELYLDEERTTTKELLHRTGYDR